MRLDPNDKMYRNMNCNTNSKVQSNVKRMSRTVGNRTRLCSNPYRRNNDWQKMNCDNYANANTIRKRNEIKRGSEIKKRSENFISNPLNPNSTTKKENEENNGNPRPLNYNTNGRPSMYSF